MLDVQGYGDNILRTWKVRDKSNPRYGIEIETGWVNSRSLMGFLTAIESKRLEPYCMAKEDGSISSNYGAEMVTRPLVFLEAKRVAKRILECAVSQEGYSFAGCGVHIHTTRKAWSKLALVLARRSIMGVSVDVEAFWDAFATRGQNQYCSREDSLPRRHSSFSMITLGEYARALPSYSDHYSAVSWSHRGPTLEFRLFGSTTKERTLASYVDVVDALMRYSEERAQDLSGALLLREVPAFDPNLFAQWVQTKPGYQALKWRLAHVAGLRRLLRGFARNPVAQPIALPETPETPSATPTLYNGPPLNSEDHDESLCTEGRGLFSDMRCACTCETCNHMRQVGGSNHARIFATWGFSWPQPTTEGAF